MKQTETDLGLFEDLADYFVNRRPINQARDALFNKKFETLIKHDLINSFHSHFPSKTKEDRQERLNERANVLLQSYAMCFSEHRDFQTRKTIEFFRDSLEKISEEEITVLNKAIDYVQNVVIKLKTDREKDKISRSLMMRNHLVSSIYCAFKFIENNLDEELFFDMITDFFNPESRNETSISNAYNEACEAENALSRNVETRVKEMDLIVEKAILKIHMK